MKNAFSEKIREIHARVTIGSEIFTAEYIEQVKIDTGLSTKNEFEIGTAFSSFAELTLIDKYRDFNTKEFSGKEAFVEIGVNTANGIKYQKMGKFYLEEPEKIHSLKTKIVGFDAMQRADKPLNLNLEFPATLGEVFEALCISVGLVPFSGSFPNKSTIIPIRPQFYEMTTREALADVAELAGGFCLIDRETEEVIIANFEEGDIDVNPNNTFSFKRSDEGGIEIETLVIVQTGAADYITGTGEKPYYILDNVFVQGDPEKWADAIFEEIRMTYFTSGELKFNGNPSANLWEIHSTTFPYYGQIHSYVIFPMKRTFHYTGGLTETWEAPFYSNELKDDRKAKEVRNIIKNQARLLVLEDEIRSRVTKAEILTDEEIQEILQGKPGIDGTDGKDATERYTWIRYADSPTSGMSSAPLNKKYLGIAHNKTSSTPSSNYGDYTWSLIEGKPGADGKDADDKFVWVKYAPNDKPTASQMSDNPDGMRWIGIAANKDTLIESNDYMDYTWSPLYDNSIIMGGTAPASPNLAQLWLDTSSDPNLLKRWTGDSWEIISDIAEINRILDEKVDRDALDTELDNLITQIETSISSSITQTADEFSIQFSEIVTAIEMAQDGLNSLSDEIQTNIRFTANGIELGKTNNPIGLVIEPDRISFVEGGQETAYISDNKLYIHDAHILNSLRIGNFAWIPRANGNLSLKKVT